MNVLHNQNAKNMSKNDKDNFIKTFHQEPSLHLVFKNKILLNQFKDKHCKTTEKSAFISVSKKINTLYNFKKGDSLTKTMDQLTPINEHKKYNIAKSTIY